jgi:regulator of RNase E activity RraA
MADDRFSQPDRELDRIRGLLARTSTATVQNQLFKRGLRNTFLFGLEPLNAGACRFVARAFTLRYIPAREDIDTLGVFADPAHPQRLAVETAPPGSALVMDCRCDARAASLGGILATRMLVRGVAAVVTDGSVRDSPQISQLSLPVFSAAVSASTNLVHHHAVDMQVPIGCAGVPVYPGDVLVGDREGVVVVPRELALDVARDAAGQEELEVFVLEQIEAGAPLAGTYPPGADTLARFRAWRERRGRTPE